MNIQPVTELLGTDQAAGRSSADAPTADSTFATALHRRMRTTASTEQAPPTQTANRSHATRTTVARHAVDAERPAPTTVPSPTADPAGARTVDSAATVTTSEATTPIGSALAVSPLGLPLVIASPTSAPHTEAASAPLTVDTTTAVTTTPMLLAGVNPTTSASPITSASPTTSFGLPATADVSAVDSTATDSVMLPSASSPLTTTIPAPSAMTSPTAVPMTPHTSPQQHDVTAAVPMTAAPASPAVTATSPISATHGADITTSAAATTSAAPPYGVTTSAAPPYGVTTATPSAGPTPILPVAPAPTAIPRTDITIIDTTASTLAAATARTLASGNATVDSQLLADLESTALRLDGPASTDATSRTTPSAPLAPPHPSTTGTPNVPTTAVPVPALDPTASTPLPSTPPVAPLTTTDTPRLPTNTAPDRFAAALAGVGVGVGADSATATASLDASDHPARQAGAPAASPASDHQAAERTASPVMPTHQVITPTNTHLTPASTPPTPVHAQVAAAVLPALTRRDGRYEIDLQLDPAGLGRVKLSVTMHAGEISVQMQAADSGARDMLRQNLDQLRQQLADAGFGKTSVDVGDGSATWQDPRGHAGNHDFTGTSRTGSGADGATAPESDAPTPPGDSSVIRAATDGSRSLDVKI
ncbi:hypothetical protein KEM60_00112 [Austwickia sp. TVS 96-490-7B]|uniref:flagellar hook-length control protein FliK n=1 Tax=Austwickia sp. TVS 96-490-7B TaxID=2830843 RepID=UPI001C57EDA3|nr:flagellar hook-length control protein FliK [Austwickia sp. TVS 96-490-7B]MBW3083930.1 hypothetical protein [Austwickia sp. TVS 96-490-7B]